MQKDLKMGILLDMYADLLTKKQAELLGMYYNLDYSLGEIAHIENVSRQAVFDTIKRGEKQLNALESKLRIYERYSATMEVAEQLIAAGLFDKAQTLKDIWEDE